MNIVYGVSGEGLGHVYEAIQIIGRLKREGHRVKVLTYGERALRSLAAFAPTEIEGIHLQFGPRGMSLVRTVRRNLKIFPFFLRNWGRLRRELVEFRPDVFITAYEPFTMVSSHLLGRPLVSMDNQNEILHAKAPPGTRMPAMWLVKLATRACTFGARHYVIKSLVKPEASGDRFHFVSPVIQEEIRAVHPTVGDHVFVYLTKPNPVLIEILRSIDERFYVYCGAPAGQEANLTFRTQGGTYVEDLGSCKAIIATTGFSLLADSIYLKKPYFGVPLLRQFEQTYNAHFITRLGIGEFSEAVTKAEIERFLANIPRYRARLLEHRLDPAEQEETLLALLQSIAGGQAG